jgi:hypothetical protein
MKKDNGKIYRGGINFTCDKCPKLLRDCSDHNPLLDGACPNCKGDLLKVGVGNSMVGFANWHKCRKCNEYIMERRGEKVVTNKRKYFDEFA